MSEQSVRTEATHQPSAELLVNDDITLLLYGEQDAPVIYQAVDSNRDFLALTQPGMVEGFTPEIAELFIQRMVANEAAGISAPYKIMYRGELAGSVSLSQREGNTAVLGYWLVESAQGKGIATAAARRMVSFGFNEWGLDDITLEINKSNTRSQKTARNIGALATDMLSDEDSDEAVWVIHKHD